MLGLHLGHLTAGEVKNLFAEEFEDDHVVLTEALAGPTRSYDVANEGGPVFGPLLLQDLKRRRTVSSAASHRLSSSSYDEHSNVYLPVRGSC